MLLIVDARMQQKLTGMHRITGLYYQTIARIRSISSNSFIAQCRSRLALFIKPHLHYAQVFCVFNVLTNESEAIQSVKTEPHFRQPHAPIQHFFV